MRTLVFTDLDGTLLDEKYSWRGAKSALAELRRLNVPLILCTSKTRAEVHEIRTALGNRDPYSVENGGLVVIPRGSPLAKVAGATGKRDLIFQLGKNYPDILKTLESLAKSSGVPIRGFHQMTTAELARDTGLTLRQARQALQRESSEPFRFLNGSDRKIRHFVQLAKKRGYEVQRGGRFWHLSAGSDKGHALQFLAALYEMAWQSPIRVIAMGDAPNDLGMLANADIPILLASSSGEFDPHVTATVPHVRRVSRKSPDAWSRAVLQAVRLSLAEEATKQSTKRISRPKLPSNARRCGRYGVWLKRVLNSRVKS
jgi:mannosyl-3-phosphoglycerate phosphatase